MTIEEKAQAYDKALKRANKQRADYQKELDKTDKNSQLAGLLKAGISAIDMAFPELKDIEDERIRKQLVDIVAFIPEANFKSASREDCRAYLEKQKEQKPVEYLDKDKIYAIMKKLHDLSFSQRIPINSEEFKQIGEITKDVRELLDYPIDQKLANSEEKFESIDNSFRRGREVGFSEGVESAKQSAEWSEEDEKMVLFWNMYYEHEVDDWSNKDVVEHLERFQEWFNNRFKSLRPQPKQELSIEKAIQWFEDTFFFQNNSSGRGEDYEITTHDFDSLEEMYNSFRKAVSADSQSQWKPSEEQIDYLQQAIEEAETEHLYALQRGLINLMEELNKLS